ncbi:MAG TPA: GYF domain-containing protein, partial [Myxococcaceae bacterium]|nr:GYF domain-containing protein [Myxococcaceae bacterium]
MRFVCDSCRAQYMISDDKVGAKGVKVRCKKCGFVILVRKPEPESQEEMDATRVGVVNPFMNEAGAPAGDGGGPSALEDSTRPGLPAGEDALLGAVRDDEIGAVFDQVLKKSGAYPAASSDPFAALSPPEDESEAPDEFDSTRVVSADALKKMAKDAEAAGGDKSKADEPSPASSSRVPTQDWYVAVNDEQTGPISLDRVKELWERGEITAASLCWRPGLGDWIPLSEMKDLTAVLAPRPAKPVIVAPASVTAPMSQSMVESAFAAGL